MKLITVLLLLTITTGVHAVEVQKIALTLEPQELEFKPPYDSEYSMEYLKDGVKIRLSVEIAGNEYKNDLSRMDVYTRLDVEKNESRIVEKSHYISLDEIPAEKITLFEIIDIKIEKKEDTLVLLVAHNKKIQEADGIAKLEVKKPGTYIAYDSKMRGIRVLEIGEDSVSLQYVNLNFNDNGLITYGKATHTLELKEKEYAEYTDSELFLGIEKLVPNESVTITLSGRQIVQQLKEYTQVKSYKSVYQGFDEIELIAAQPVILRFQIEKKSLKIRVADRSAGKARLEIYEGNTPICTSYQKTCTIKLGEINQELGKKTGIAFLLTLINPYRAYITIKPYSEIDCKPVEGAYYGDPKKKLDLLIILGDASTETNRKYTEKEFLKEINKALEAFYSVPEFAPYRKRINIQYVFDERVRPDCITFDEENLWGKWSCSVPPTKYQICDADRAIIFVPTRPEISKSFIENRGRRAEIGRSNSYFTEIGYPNVAVHELAHRLFNLDDTYEDDGGYKNINAYLGNCDYAETRIRNRNLEEKYAGFKNGLNHQTKPGDCYRFKPDEKKYPNFKEVSVLQPTDLMSNHNDLFLNFDAEYQVEQVMKEYPS